MGMILRVLLLSLACATAQAQTRFITVASTTSTEQSGLFAHLLPAFKKDKGIDVRVVAVGTGQALDMGRRGLHNEASELLRSRLTGKIETDLDTARRLFTLICALHWKG